MNSFSETFTKKWFLNVMVVLLIILTNITLLNFVIAILSNTYTKLTTLSTAIYLKHIISLRIQKGYDKYYSSLVSPFIGYNILFIPFIPLVLVCKSKRVNKTILFIQWIPYACIGILLWMVCEVVLMVIAIPFKLRKDIK